MSRTPHRAPLTVLRLLAPLLVLLAGPAAAPAGHVKIVKADYHIDAVDPGIRLFVRAKMAEGTTRVTDDTVVLFVHGATFPSTPDFDLEYKDYSWADWLVERGYVVYMFDKRNYGFSTREKAMDEPARDHKPLSRSYLVIRDIGAVVDHIRAKHRVNRVTLIGWSWGAMTAGYYTSLHSEKVRKLVMYAPAYAFPLHTNLGPGSALQNKRRPYEFNYGLGAYRLVTAAANQARWDGEIPVEDKTQYREPGVVDAFHAAALATDPTSGSRTPPSLRAPNGVLEDTFMQATGRPIWNASSIYVPVLVIAGEYDTWSYPEDREGLLRDLTNAPVKKHVVIRNATHFVLFEKPRFEFFEEILRFLRE
ncbi:MAG TPA: alpha/beta hydrolase [Thermodesulfobacteriota bacterium]|nr:alpha/beta hydrolase [Thermodesulfobacteriota bacterium]